MPEPMTARRRKLPARYAAILMPLILSLLMTFLVSGISTALNVGLSAQFLALWPKAWGFSWLVAFPALLVLLPFVRRLVGLLVEAPGK